MKINSIKGKVTSLWQSLSFWGDLRNRKEKCSDVGVDISVTVRAAHDGLTKGSKT